MWILSSSPLHVPSDLLIPQHESKNLKSLMQGDFWEAWSQDSGFTKKERFSWGYTSDGEEQEVRVRKLYYELSDRITLVFELRYINGKPEGPVEIHKNKRY